jgi:hypothetical protein
MLPLPVLAVPVAVVAWKLISHGTTHTDMAANAPPPSPKYAGMVGPPPPPATPVHPSVLTQQTFLAGKPTTPAQAQHVAQQQAQGGVIGTISAIASVVPPSAVTAAGGALGSLFSGWGSSNQVETTSADDVSSSYVADNSYTPTATADDWGSGGGFQDDSGDMSFA